MVMNAKHAAFLWFISRATHLSIDLVEARKAATHWNSGSLSKRLFHINTTEIRYINQQCWKATCYAIRFCFSKHRLLNFQHNMHFSDWCDWKPLFLVLWLIGIYFRCAQKHALVCKSMISIIFLECERHAQREKDFFLLALRFMF